MHTLLRYHDYNKTNQSPGQIYSIASVHFLSGFLLYLYKYKYLYKYITYKSISFYLSISTYLTPLNPLSVRPFVRPFVRPSVCPSVRQNHLWA